MTKLLLLAMLGVAAGAASWAWSRRRLLELGRLARSWVRNLVHQKRLRLMTEAKKNRLTGATAGKTQPPGRHTKSNRRKGRGGGPWEPGEESPPVKPPPPRRPATRLRLLCCRDKREWQLAVELPEDSSEGCEVKVRQNDKPLEPARFNENRWTLNQLKGRVEAVEVGDGGRRWELEFRGDEYLLFKLLKGRKTAEGRRVSAATRGEYLLITPATWTVCERPGVELHPKRDVGVDGYVSYRFRVGDGVLPQIEFPQRDGQRAAVEFRTACFTLEGDRADADFGEYEAPLFLQSPPSVRALNAKTWSQVQTLFLGVAGRGRNKWNKGIKPNPTNDEVRLSEPLNGRKGGWYFVRLYDAKEELIESHYFAFAAPLKDLKIIGASVLPGADGHKAARLEFEHEPNASVVIHGEHERQTSETGTVFIIPARGEQVDWQINWPADLPLKCTTRIERIWWAVGGRDTPPAIGDWADKPVEVRRSDFRAAANKLFYVRLPVTLSVKEFFAGFSRDEARRFTAQVGQREVSFRLQEFEGAEQLEIVGCSCFKIWVAQNGLETSAQVLRLEIVYECCFCQKRFSTDAEALAHAVEHEKEFIRELSYPELRGLDPDLPPAIYQCLHRNCGWYVRADDFANPTSTISRHIEHMHPNPHGSTQISFRVVTDLDEIRRNVITGLPQIFQCKRCGEKFEKVQPKNFAEHIFSKHRSQLFNVV